MRGAFILKAGAKVQNKSQKRAYRQKKTKLTVSKIYKNPA
jgi:hypothetical protein